MIDFNKNRNSIKKLFSKENLKKAADTIKQKTGITDEDLSSIKKSTNKIKDKIVKTSKKVTDNTAEAIEKSEIKEKLVNAKERLITNESKEIAKNIFSIHTLKKTTGAAVRNAASIFGVLAFCFGFFSTVSFLMGLYYYIEFNGGTIGFILGTILLLLFTLSMMIAVILSRVSSPKYWIKKEYKPLRRKTGSSIKDALSIIKTIPEESIQKEYQALLLENKKLVWDVLQDLQQISLRLQRPFNDLHVLKRKILLEAGIDNFHFDMMAALIQQYKKTELLQDFLLEMRKPLEDNINHLQSFVRSIRSKQSGNGEDIIDAVKGLSINLEAVNQNFNNGLQGLTEEGQ